MKNKHLLALRKALKPLLNDPMSKPCKDYTYSCYQCMTARIIEDFRSYIFDFMESDEEIEAYLKKFEKAKKKYSKAK